MIYKSFDFNYSQVKAKSRMAIVFIPDENKYAFFDINKSELKPCRFDSEDEAFADIYKYIKLGKVDQIEIMDRSTHTYSKEMNCIIG